MKSIPVNIKYLPDYELFVPADEDYEKVLESVGGIDTEGFESRIPELYNICNGKKVVDVGAYIGDTSLTFFLSAGADLVLSFEPFFDSWTCLCLNCPYDRISKINDPVGDGSLVSLIGDNVTSGMRYVGWGNGNVQTVRLDDVIIFDPSLIKIDVEGFEPAVLEGAKKLIDRSKPVILIECFPQCLARYGWTPENIEKPLVDAGYTLKNIGCRTGPSDVRWDILALPK